jgi:hypothetical protein
MKYKQYKLYPVDHKLQLGGHIQPSAPSSSRLEETHPPVQSRDESLDDRAASLASKVCIPSASLEDKTVREVLQLKINIKSTYRLSSMGYLLGSEEPLDWRVRMREPVLVQLTKHHLAWLASCLHLTHQCLEPCQT